MMCLQETIESSKVNPPGYGNVSETDGDLANDGRENSIDVTLSPEEDSAGNNFVEIELGEITGRITADVDNNDTGDSGLSGVVLTLSDRNGVAIVDGNNNITATTNEQGEYIFRDVRPGNYTVVETQPNEYANVSEVDGGEDKDNLDSSVVNSIPVVVTPGETDRGNDFVEEQFGSVTGKVSANTSTGIQNLRRVAIELRDSEGNIVETIATNDQGNYKFERVLPGNYSVVELQPATYSDVREVDGLNDGGDDSDNGDNLIVNSIPVKVDAGERDGGNNFVEIENGSIVGNVSRDDDNNGSGDRNLADITVTLDDGAGNILTTTTDTDGNYLFEDLTPGNYVITQDNDPDFVDVSDIEGANDSQIAVTIGAGENVTAQNFVDEVPASIAGNVSRDDDNNGTGDRNLADITVTLDDGAGNILTTTTDTDGNYKFEDVTPGNYTIVQANETDFVDVSDVEGANNSQIELTVGIGQSVTAQNFIDEVPASIAGNVSRDDDNDGEGDRNLADITVNLLDPNGGTVATTQTLTNGNYLFEDVTPGNYTIVQENDTDFVDVGDIDSINDSQISVSVGIGESVTAQNFVDEVPASVAGNVSRDDDNNGTGDRNLEGISITLDDSAGNVLTTTTDTDGNYLFEDVTPGNYIITQANNTNFVDVSDVEGANNSQIELTVGIGQSVTDRDFVDEIPASIAGNVSQDNDNDGDGDLNLEGVNVELIDDAGNTILTATTDANGDYSFNDVTPGNYQIQQTNLTGYGDVSANVLDVTLAVGETITDIDFVDELGRIAGNVKVDDDDNDTGDRPIENVTVELLDTNGNIVATTLTNTQGNYEFADLLAGDYRVRQLNLSDYGDVSDPVLNVALAAGETNTGNDFVDELGHISGNVTVDDDDNNTGDRPDRKCHG